MNTTSASKNQSSPDAFTERGCRADLDTLQAAEWRLRIGGNWTRSAKRPAPAEVVSALEQGRPARLRLREEGLEQWDSTLLAYLLPIVQSGEAAQIEVDTSGLRKGLVELLRLARSVPERETAAETNGMHGMMACIGQWGLLQAASVVRTVSFLGETTIALFRMMLGRARYRRTDLLEMFVFCGPEALPIISLIAVLMGLILAFVGAIQLRMFGAEIYVADLVGIGLVRAMAAIMTGVVMSGRSGAAFAAQIGTMHGNDEIDALRTMGLNPVEFLVLPRLVALTVMMPLLCLYANAMGILGGMVVGVGVLDLGLVQYWNETVEAVGVNDLLVGLVMGVVFGFLVSLAGCLRGMQSERSSSAVGQAATSAVVTSIVWIVVATAVITVICDVLGV